MVQLGKEKKDCIKYDHSTVRSSGEYLAVIDTL